MVKRVGTLEERSLPLMRKTFIEAGVTGWDVHSLTVSSAYAEDFH